MNAGPQDGISDLSEADLRGSRITGLLTNSILGEDMQLLTGQAWYENINTVSHYYHAYIDYMVFCTVNKL